LESVLRNCDGKKITEDDVARSPTGKRRESELKRSFRSARVLLQDFTGVPLLVDLAAMRSGRFAAFTQEHEVIGAALPVDLVIDHSIQVDFASTKDALRKIWDGV